MPRERLVEVRLLRGALRCREPLEEAAGARAEAVRASGDLEAFVVGRAKEGSSSDLGRVETRHAPTPPVSPSASVMVALVRRVDPDQRWSDRPGHRAGSYQRPWRRGHRTRIGKPP